MHDTASDRPFTMLLCTDDSAAAQAAQEWASRLRPARPVVIDVLCVAGLGVTRLGWGLQTHRAVVRQAVDQLRQSEVIAAERVANAAGERLQRAGTIVRVWARQGNTVDEILAMIDTDRPDLVLLGPRGRSGLAQLLLGSVSHQVIVASPRPVLVARRPPPGEGVLPRHVLAVLDGTPAAEAAIAWVAESGLAASAKVTLLGLLGVAPGLESDEGTVGRELAGALRADATDALDRLAESLQGRSESLEIALEIGHPIEATLHAVDDLGPDLVTVAGPPRRRGQDPFAEKIARYAPTSVLVVPRA